MADRVDGVRPRVASEQRSLASYLLLPRPKDAVKWWIFPIAFAYGAAASGGVSDQQLLRALLGWVALELLIYQARYQWNDIRGFDADQRHPDAGARGRLPGPLEAGRRNKAACWAVAVFRLALAAALALAFPSLDLLAPLAALAAAVFAVAVLYEVLRSAATGRGGSRSTPVTPVIASLWLVVGGGYAVRGVAGLGFGFDLAEKPAAAVAAMIALWAFGVAFVTGRWAIESLAFANMDGDALTWRARREQAREHTLALTRWLPTRVPGGIRSLRDWRPLLVSGPATPWNAAAIVSAGAAGALGRIVAGPADVGGVAACVALGVLLAMIVIAPTWGAGVAWVLAAAAVTVGAALADVPRPGLATLPWIVLVGSHLFFSAQSLTTLGHPLRALFPRTPPAAQPERA